MQWSSMEYLYLTMEVFIRQPLWQCPRTDRRHQEAVTTQLPAGAIGKQYKPVIQRFSVQQQKAVGAEAN